MLVDDFLPIYDVSDEVATAVRADVQTTWDALMEADLIEVGRQRPLVALLGAVRILPDLIWQRLHGEHPPAAPERLTLRETTKLGRALPYRDLAGVEPLGDHAWSPTARPTRTSRCSALLPRGVAVKQRSSSRQAGRLSAALRDLERKP